MDAFLEKLGIALPIVQAPMAGGPDTPELAAAVSEAGGLGSLGCAYLSGEAIDGAAARLRRQTQKPFALNLFVRDDPPDDAEAVARVTPILAPDALVGTMALTRQIVAGVRVPVIAAGGIMDGAGIRAALDLGASAVQLGTAFMLCPEAGTHPAHRAALTSPAARTTVVTRAFSGRAARGVRNRMTDAFEGVVAAPFPRQQELTADVRAEAAAQGRGDLMQLWAGQAAALIRSRPAGELVRALAAEAGLGAA